MFNLLFFIFEKKCKDTHKLDLFTVKSSRLLILTVI